jgi:hypothetical protein
MTTETKAKALADAFYAAFEEGEREWVNEYGSKTFRTLRRDCPKWMQDAIRECHIVGGDTILPNDWIYDACHTMVSNMTDTDPDGWEDAAHEWADSSVDVYNDDRAKWAASHLRFGCAVDEAVEELGHSDHGFHGDIGIGQYHVLRNIAGTLISAVQKQAEGDDESDD